VHIISRSLEAVFRGQNGGMCEDRIIPMAMEMVLSLGLTNGVGFHGLGSMGIESFCLERGC